MIKWWYFATFLRKFVKKQKCWYDLERKLEDWTRRAKESPSGFPIKRRIPFKERKKKKEMSLVRCFSLRVWAMSQVITSLHLIHHFPQTNKLRFFSPSAPFQRLFSRSLFQTRSDCGTVEDCERDDRRSDSHCVCLAACEETLCVSVWNNASGCVEEIFFFG